MDLSVSKSTYRNTSYICVRSFSLELIVPYFLNFLVKRHRNHHKLRIRPFNMINTEGSMDKSLKMLLKGPYI